MTPLQLKSIAKSGAIGHFTRLHFSEVGAQKLAAVAGYIQGLREGGKAELADALAEDLVTWFQYLEEYGGFVTRQFSDGREVQFPKFRIKLGASSYSQFDFSLTWYRFSSTDMEEGGKLLPDWGGQFTQQWQSQAMRERGEPHECIQAYYVYAMDGGLNFSGRDQFLTEPVRPQKPGQRGYGYWSVNT